MKVSIRDEKAVRRVVDLCLALEEKALGIYESLRDNEKDTRLRGLWTTLVADETEHRKYWQRLKEVCAVGGVPEVFDEPRRYVDELETLMSRLDNVDADLNKDRHPPQVFIHVLRLEFLLLHPAFVTLFHYLPEDSEVVSPSRTYEQHLGRILAVLMDFESLPPELELLGEAIGQVWKKSDESASEAVTDSLTGTLNRRGLHVAMKPLACLARREKETAGVMIFEVTNLKKINKTHGYKTGDAVLSAVAAAVSSRLRSSDVLGRFGGDDFLALLTRFDKERFEQVGCEIAALAGEVTAGDDQVSLAVGGAFTVMGNTAETQLETLMREADKALDTAREGGSACVVTEIP